MSNNKFTVLQILVNVKVPQSEHGLKLTALDTLDQAIAFIGLMTERTWYLAYQAIDTYGNTVYDTRS